LDDFRRAKYPWADFHEDDISFEKERPVITSGGFCDLFIGRDGHGVRLALKRPRLAGQPNAKELERVLHVEAKTWRRLQHDHILPFLGILAIDSEMYLVSPFMEFGSLAPYLASHPEADRPKLVRETASAIAYLHDHGIVHGDIKGSNILISDNCKALLCDFGLARAVSESTAAPPKRAGRGRWQAPELFSENARKTFKTDVYAFGITIEQILTGSDQEVIKLGYTRGRPPSEPNSVSYAGSREVARRCWAADPHQRPAMPEVLDALTRLSVS